MTLTEFLLARIAEDERAANADWSNLGYDPARVLAECEAKRRILDLHRSGEVCDPCSGWLGTDPAADCPTLRLLALPYADHPDYRAAEWKAES
jgi:hypothetical protein